jgi:hypothetical protein
VDVKGTASAEFIEFQSSRKFIVLEQDFTGVIPAKITEQSIQLVKGADQEGVIIIPVLKGVLPVEASRTEVDVTRIRAAAEKALTIHPIVLLRESDVPEAIVRSIFDSETKDLRTKAFEYFLQIFSQRHSREEAEKISRIAISLVEPITKKQEEKVKQTIEELL